MNETQMNQLIDAIKELKSNTLLEVISNIIIPLSVLILTSFITLMINKKQQEFQLKQQQIALKKELKVKALSEIRSSMVDYSRQLAILDIEIHKYFRQKIDIKVLAEKLVEVEEECRKIKVKLNANKCLITDFNIDYDKIDKMMLCLSHSIYFNYCYPDELVPEVLKEYILEKDGAKFINIMDKFILSIGGMLDELEKEINKTIESII
ncbi:hypothetical protein AXY43_23055 [Clostridium sp. MF28]|uniref:hypothetical protein n=1 Tax=Clostridium TaxID=1485 RepID=UPI000CFA56D4|nr:MULTISPECIES: hypothetical protein [Clostridium]AVK50661.1 hypothetical protein AXY43_23055 [Clostridium sp. MF28]PSM59009.1 hypothetical protein C4L39_03890 [Clostridium diolis]